MIISCAKCKTKYHLDEAVTTRMAFKARCSRCGHLFTAFKPPLAGTPENRVDISAGRSSRDRVIAVSNQKGGVAKTTTCLNLGISLTLFKKRVLLIDFDVQSNLTLSLGYRGEKSFYDILRSDTAAMEKIIKKTRYPNLWLLPADSRMAILTQKYMNEDYFEYLLWNRLNLIRDQFDFILIDTPPSIEFFTLNALIASNFVVIPSQCEYLSINGVDQIEKIIRGIRERKGHQIDYKVLVTMYNPENTASKVICTKMKNNYRGKIFSTTIEFDSKVQESQIMNMPIIHYDRKSVSARQYFNLAREIIGA